MVVAYMNRVFRNAMALEILMELIGIFTGNMVLAEVAVVALTTTMVLWQVYLKAEEKARRKAVKKCN